MPPVQIVGQQIFPSELARRKFRFFLEDAGKIVGILKSALLGYFAYRHIGIEQKILRQFHFFVLDILDRRQLKSGTEQIGKVDGIQVHDVGELQHGDIFIQMRIDERKDGEKPQDVLVEKFRSVEERRKQFQKIGLHQNFIHGVIRRKQLDQLFKQPFCIFIGTVFLAHIQDVKVVERGGHQKMHIGMPHLVCAARGNDAVGWEEVNVPFCQIYRILMSDDVGRTLLDIIETVMVQKLKRTGR